MEFIICQMCEEHEILSKIHQLIENIANQIQRIVYIVNLIWTNCIFIQNFKDKNKSIVLFCSFTRLFIYDMTIYVDIILIENLALAASISINIVTVYFCLYAQHCKKFNALSFCVNVSSCWSNMNLVIRVDWLTLSILC